MPTNKCGRALNRSLTAPNKAKKLWLASPQGLTLKPVSSCLTLRTEHLLELPYPLMMCKLTCATMNLNRRGVDKLPHIHELMKELQCNIMSLREVDINSFSCPGFIQLGKKLGLSLALGGLSPQAQIARVAIVSNLPFRQVRFSSISQPHRYCARLGGRRSSGHGQLLRALRPSPFWTHGISELTWIR